MKNWQTGLRAIAIAVIALMAAGTATLAIAAEAVTLIAVRHGDRDSNFVDELNPTGIERMQALVSALDGVQIDAIYIPPDRVRNVQSAEPLATARGLEPIIVDMGTMTRTLLDGNEGKTIIWIGNTGNLETLWDRIQAKDPPPVKYGDLFTVQVKNDKAGPVTKSYFGP